MDPKELKALLKEAKDCLKSKDFATAIKNCKIILKSMPDHYQAHLYMGTGHKEQGKWQQAIESYKKATECDPNQVFAWQGIILTYERQGIKNHKDLLDAYKRVATFFEKDDKAKYIESTKKLANVLISQQDSKGAIKVITRLAKSYGVDLEIASMIEKLLAGTKYETRTPEQNELYTQALETVVTESPKPTEETCKKYFTQVNRCGNYDTVIKQALAMKAKWNFYSSPMEWLCRYYIEGRLNSVTLKETGAFDLLTDKLFKLHPSSNFGHFARGKFLIDEGLFMNDGFSFISTGLESNYNLYALKILIRGRLDYGDFGTAVENCMDGLRNFSNDLDACIQLRLFCSEGWAWLDSKKAEELLENIKGHSKQEYASQWIVVQVLLNSRKLDFDSLARYLALAKEKNVHHWLVDFYSVMMNVDSKNSETLKSAINSYLINTVQEETNLHLRLEAAIFLYNLKCYKESAEILFELTKTPIGRKRPIPWAYLGHLSFLQEDIELASKCYKKSYKLCPSADIGALLSDTYVTLGKEEANRELLSGATKEFSKLKSKWAWLRLGILHLHHGEANEAVIALQAVLRADINDCNVWESLADAYFLRGSFLAAQNSYERALSLGADPLYPKLKIGVVYQCLGHHDASINTLKSLLTEFPNDCTPVLMELARTHSLIGQQLASENFDIRAKSSVEDSLTYAVLAILRSPNRILLPWKVIGESALTLNSINENVLIKVPTFLLGDNPNQLDPSKILTVEDFRFEEVSLDKLRQIGIQAVLECLTIIESPKEDGQILSGSSSLRAYLYHQLSLLYFNRGRRLSQSLDLKTSADLYYKKAIIGAKKAVAYNQTQYIFWNSLGVIAYFVGNEELSQHAFIKSLEIEGNNVVAWCNLGMLYLKHDQPFLAHKVFNKAQSVSPLHSYCWIGQGLVAEKLDPSEAADLFRHASHLEPSPFSVSCYTDWICGIILKKTDFKAADYMYNIDRVDALTIVNDLITRVELRDHTPHMYNMKGIIAALNGFFKTALESFTTALQLLEVDANLNVPATFKQQILLNRITILLKLENYQEALEAFGAVQDLDHVGCAVGALLMGKRGNYEQSEKLYLQLLDLLPESDLNQTGKIDITIALGLINNLHYGPDAACKLLTQDFMVQSPHGLLALAAIGILNSESEFVNNVMEHLEPFQHHENVLPDIAFIKACYQIMNGNSSAGVIHLLKLVHANPWNGRLWSMLSQIIFHHEFHSIRSSTFQKITMTALKLSSLKKRVNSNSSAMISLTFLMNDDCKTTITTALKGIRKYPQERENWIVLACAFWYQYAETKDIKIYTKVVQLLEKELSLSRVQARAEEWARSFLSLVQNYRPSK